MAYKLLRRSAIVSNYKFTIAICCCFSTFHVPIQLIIHSCVLFIFFLTCRECSSLMVGFHQKAGTGKLTGVHRKYCSSKFSYTAKCEPACFLLENQLQTGPCIAKMTITLHYDFHICGADCGGLRATFVAPRRNRNLFLGI